MLMIGLVLLLVPPALVVAAYVGYPLFLFCLPKHRVQARPRRPDDAWPEVTISVPVYNEERAIAATLERLLALDYPAERRHIVVISDASADGTDDIVRGFADRGVRLIRLPERSGKTAAENEAGRHLEGEIVVNIDATISVPPHALRALVAAFDDPTVGVASGRDVSVGDTATEGNRDESTYVGYEMWIRRLETERGTIVGASGCFYAIRRSLFDEIFPVALSRDFASPLIAREAGYRSVSVDAAVCFVPRTRSLRSEYRRKVRTMTRGLETLWFKRHLLNPFRYGRFSIFLAGHKLLRWLLFPSLPLGLIGLVLVTVAAPALWPLAALSGAAVSLGLIGWAWPAGRAQPRLLSLMAFVVIAQVAGVVAWVRAARGELDPVWEPTRRPDALSSAGSAPGPS